MDHQNNYFFMLTKKCHRVILDTQQQKNTEPNWKFLFDFHTYQKWWIHRILCFITNISDVWMDMAKLKDLVEIILMEIVSGETILPHCFQVNTK